MDEEERRRPRALRTRRLLATGGTRLTPHAATFYEVLGEVLAAEPGLVVTTGGFHHFVNKRDVPSADFSIARGFLSGRDERGESPTQRLETLLPTRDQDWDEIQRFRLGKVIELSNSSSRARRFRLVYVADVVVGIAGGDGTSEIIENAMATDTPVLPLPFAGGACEKCWSAPETHAQIVGWFGRGVEILEGIDLPSLNGRELTRLAHQVRDLLLIRLRKKCLVCMPYGDPHDALYDDVIVPAIEFCEVLPMRLDRIDLPGNALRLLRDAIATCDVTLVDVTGNNPNVMYELGLVHGLDKPAIVTCRRGTPEDTPFNIRNERIIFYDGKDDLGRALMSLL